MKNFTKGFLSGVLVLTLILSSVGFAAVKLQKIEVLLNTVKLSVDGKYVSGENIIYKDRLYLPADKVTPAIGKKLVWDKKKNTASIETPIVKSKYSINNPAPIKTTQSVTVDNVLSVYTSEITVNEVLRGDEAWELIEAANQFNKKPADGKEFLLAKVTYKLNKITDDKSYSLSPVSFHCFTSKNKEYDRVFAVTPEPELRTTLYAGASETGWIVFEVDVDEKAPKMGYGQKYDGTGGVWFMLSEGTK